MLAHVTKQRTSLVSYPCVVRVLQPHATTALTRTGGGNTRTHGYETSTSHTVDMEHTVPESHKACVGTNQTPLNGWGGTIEWGGGKGTGSTRAVVQA